MNNKDFYDEWFSDNKNDLKNEYCELMGDNFNEYCKEEFNKYFDEVRLKNG